MRVQFVTYPHIGLASGGLQTQIEKTRSALIARNVEVVNFDPWNPDLDPSDIVHIFSLHSALYESVISLASRGHPIVVSSVFSQLTPPWLTGVKRRAALYSRGVLADLRRASLMLRCAHAIISLTSDEHRQLVLGLGAEMQRIKTIGNGIDDEFRNLLAPKPPTRDVVCIARIDKNKNQLNLARACRDLGLSLTLVGPIGPGEQEYFRCIESNLGPDDIYLGPILGDPSKLASVILEHKIFALTSHREALPIAALEALATGIMCLLPKNSGLPALYQSSGAISYCSGKSSDISKKLSDMLQLSSPPEIRYQSIPTWTDVATELVEVYREAKDAAKHSHANVTSSVPDWRVYHEKS